MVTKINKIIHMSRIIKNEPRNVLAYESSYQTISTATDITFDFLG